MKKNGLPFKSRLLSLTSLLACVQLQPRATILNFPAIPVTIHTKGVATIVSMRRIPQALIQKTRQLPRTLLDHYQQLTLIEVD